MSVNTEKLTLAFLVCIFMSFNGEFTVELLEVFLVIEFWGPLVSQNPTFKVFFLKFLTSHQPLTCQKRYEKLKGQMARSEDQLQSNPLYLLSHSCPKESQKGEAESHSHSLSICLFGISYFLFVSVIFPLLNCKFKT